MRRIVWWVKRDARLADNPALSDAVRRGGEVLPVFCEEPSLLAQADRSVMHRDAQRQAVAALRAELRHYGAEVYVAHAEVVPTLANVRAWFPFDEIVAHEEVGTLDTWERDRAVSAWCAARGVTYTEHPQSAVTRGGATRERLAEVWHERVEAVAPLPRPAVIPMAAATWSKCAATRLPEFALPAMAALWQPVSERDADRTLRSFLDDRSRWYHGGISSPGVALWAGSRLSPHLAWGTLTVRQAVHALQRRIADLSNERPDNVGRWRRGLAGCLARLRWRDHFVQRLETVPSLEFRALHPAFRDVPFENDPHLLEAWANGDTGFPLVDAVMRCLRTIGFVNFRMRAMAVSFAVHALHLDWRVIHPALGGVFRDYEPGLHFSQLQMQAGVSGSATLRVYNPWKQLVDQDPACGFVRRWVPELRDATTERIRRHASDPVPGYRPPCVNFEIRTRWMKDVLFGIRGTTDARRAAADLERRLGARPAGTVTRGGGVGRRVRADQRLLFR